MSKTVITDFLRRCIEYADASISRKIERGDDSDIIAEWKAYRNYTQYSLEEIEKVFGWTDVHRNPPPIHRHMHTKENN